MILEKLTITDTFKQWRDKINAIINEYEGVPSTDQTTGILTIDTDRTQADSFVVDIPSTFNDKTTFTDTVVVRGELDAISNSTKKLETPITFNGVLFDGTRDVTTPLWGVSRDIQISDYSGANYGELVQVNGSSDYIFRMPKTFTGVLDGEAKYATNIKNKRIIDGVSFDGSGDVTHYAVCSSASGSQIKEVTIPNFVLFNGAVVTIKFLNANTASEPKLNVSNTGAKSIYLKDSPIDQSAIPANSTYIFVYDGFNFNLITGVDNSVTQNISAMDVTYPLLASPIRDGVNKTTSTLFCDGIVMNPSRSTITINGDYITKHKFIATINNSSENAVFTARNSDELYTLTPNVSTYIRCLSYEDKNSKMLGALEYQKNPDNSKYANIVVPKFNANGEETAHSVLQVGWDGNNSETMNFNGSATIQSNLTIGNEATFASYVQLKPYGWLKSFDRDTDGTGAVREFVVSSDKYTTDWNTTGAAIALYSKNSVKNPGQLVLKAGSSAGNWAAIDIQPSGSLLFKKRTSANVSTNLMNIDTNGNVSFAGNVSGAKIYNAVFNDYAEFFEKGEETEAGDIVALDITSNEERYVKATDKSKLVVGIHSDSYGHILGGEKSIEDSEKTHIPVGLSGRVYVKFKGKSILGEGVVPSDTPGVGRLYDEFLDDKRKIVGYIVYDPEPSSPNERKVRVLINR